MYNLLKNNLKSIVITALIILLIPILIWLVIWANTKDRNYYLLNSLNVYLNTNVSDIAFDSKVFVSNKNNNSIDFLSKFEEIVDLTKIGINKVDHSQNNFTVYNPFKNIQMFDVNFPKNESISLEARYEKGKLSFYSTDQIIFVNDEKIINLGQLEYEIEGVNINDVYRINDRYIFIKNILEGEKYLIPSSYFAEPDIESYEVSEENYLGSQNNNFNEGLWQEKVSDCSQTNPGEADIDMQLTDTIYGKSLKLISNNHFACTNKRFNIRENISSTDRLIFNVNYRNIKTNNGAFFVRLIDKTQRQIFDEIGNIKIIIPEVTYLGNLNSTSKNWVSSSMVFEPKLDNLFLADIYLYSKSFGQKTEIDIDNVGLYKILSSRKSQINKISKDISTTTLNRIKLNYGDNKISVPTDERNIIELDNHSFEQGLWQKQAIDCTDNEPGEPEFSLGLSNDAVDGENSVLMTSKNHSACIYRKFNATFDPAFVYQLSFNYKNLEGDGGMYFIKVNGRSGASSQVFSERLEYSKEWTKKQVQISDEIIDIESIEIYFYSNSNGKLSSVLYDDIKINALYPLNIVNYFFESRREKQDPKGVVSIERGMTKDSINLVDTNSAIYTRGLINASELSEQAYIFNNGSESFIKSKDKEISITNSKFSLFSQVIKYYILTVVILGIFYTIYLTTKNRGKKIIKFLNNNYLILQWIGKIILLLISIVSMFFFNFDLSIFLFCSLILFIFKIKFTFVKYFALTLLCLSAILILLKINSLAETFAIYSFFLILIYSLEEFTTIFKQKILDEG